MTAAMVRNAIAYRNATGKTWAEVAAGYGVSASALEEGVRRLRDGGPKHAAERSRDRYDLILAMAADGVFDRPSLAPALGIAPGALAVWWSHAGLDDVDLFAIAVEARMRRLPGVGRAAIEDDLRAEHKTRKVNRAAVLKMQRAAAAGLEPLREAA